MLMQFVVVMDLVTGGEAGLSEIEGPRRGGDNWKWN